MLLGRPLGGWAGARVGGACADVRRVRAERAQRIFAHVAAPRSPFPSAGGRGRAGPPRNGPGEAAAATQTSLDELAEAAQRPSAAPFPLASNLGRAAPAALPKPPSPDPKAPEPGGASKALRGTFYCSPKGKPVARLALPAPPEAREGGGGTISAAAPLRRSHGSRGW